MAGKRCPQCGEEYELHEKFCSRDGATLVNVVTSTDMIGRVIADRYRILRQLGEGGMGEVFLAEHVRLHRKSAVKVIRASLLEDGDAVSRFNREALNASHVEHPNVAEIYDFGETDDGLLYLAMEYINGQSLAEHLAAGGPMEPSRVLRILAAVAAALGAAHELGIIHRDLKPENVMISTARDGEERVKLLDFGIAKAPNAAEQKVTQSGAVIGTPAYMSPEQVRGESNIDARSDVYALGLLAFKMLTCNLPFGGATPLELMASRLHTAPARLGNARPDIAWPEAMERVFQRALAGRRDDRYTTPTAFVDALATAASEMPAAEQGAEATTEVIRENIPGGLTGQVDVGADPHQPSIKTITSARASGTRVRAILIMAMCVIGAFGFWSVRGRFTGPLNAEHPDTMRERRDGTAGPRTQSGAGPGPAHVRIGSGSTASPPRRIQLLRQKDTSPPSGSGAIRPPVTSTAKDVATGEVGDSTVDTPARLLRIAIDSLRVTVAAADANAQVVAAVAGAGQLLQRAHTRSDSVSILVYRAQGQALIGDLTAACATLSTVKPLVAGGPLASSVGHTAQQLACP